jgi:hypothetical protein
MVGGLIMMVVIGSIIMVIIFGLYFGIGAITWTYSDFTSNGGNVGNDFSDAIAAFNNFVYPQVWSQELWISTSSSGGVYAAYANGSPCYATIYRNATDPSYGQLMAFLEHDNTEDAEYIPGQYVCTNFAIHLADDAEQNGMKAHVVVVTLSGNPDGENSHMCDAFNTTDAGWIYIDDTGRTAQEMAEGASEEPCMVNMVVGAQYIRTPIPPLSGYSADLPMGAICSYQALD